MGNYAEINLEQPKAFFKKMKRAANGGFKKELEKFLEETGKKFLLLVEEEIKKRKIVDTSFLQTSFKKGGADNLWELNTGEMSLLVGTKSSEAASVNSGYWTNTAKTEQLLVPGYWQGSKFIYDSTANSGMVLQQKWVEGAHYWEGAMNAMEKLFPGLMEAKVQAFMTNYLK